MKKLLAIILLCAISGCADDEEVTVDRECYEYTDNNNNTHIEECCETICVDKYDEWDNVYSHSCDTSCFCSIEGEDDYDC